MLMKNEERRLKVEQEMLRLKPFDLHSCTFLCSLHPRLSFQFVYGELPNKQLQLHDGSPDISFNLIGIHIYQLYIRHIIVRQFHSTAARLNSRPNDK